MKKLLTSVTLIGLGVLITGYGAWGKDSGASDKKLADMYRIDQIEKTWHKAASRKNLKLMMSLWAPKATMTVGGHTYTGKTAIRGVFERSGPFQAQNHWESDTPGYKTRDPQRDSADPRFLRPHVWCVQAGEPLGVGHACLQDPDHGQRGQRHALLRVPLHRRRHRQGRDSGRRGSGASEDQWEMADHQPRSVDGDAQALIP